VGFNKTIREQIHQKYDGHCAYCGEEIKIKEMQVDHIIPQYNFISQVQKRWRIPPFLTHLKETDLHHIDNLMPTCRVCNKWKSAFDLEQFRREDYEQVKRLNDYSSNFRMAKKYGLVIENVTPIVFYFERGERIMKQL
jgi:5-methylcytosine-specific restriction endonuclease McrA